MKGEAIKNARKRDLSRVKIGSLTIEEIHDMCEKCKDCTKCVFDDEGCLFGDGRQPYMWNPRWHVDLREVEE